MKSIWPKEEHEKYFSYTHVSSRVETSYKIQKRREMISINQLTLPMMQVI